MHGSRMCMRPSCAGRRIPVPEPFKSVISGQQPSLYVSDEERPGFGDELLCGIHLLPDVSLRERLHADAQPFYPDIHGIHTLKPRIFV
jgi:hypothetical protein